MASDISGTLKFYELNMELLSSCESGHAVDVWTKPEYPLINLYLRGFPMGEGKLASLDKIENAWLEKLLKDGAVIFAEIVKESSTRFQINLKRRTREEIEQRVQAARKASESVQEELYSAQLDERILIAHRLQAPYKPTTHTASASLRTPAPARLSRGDQLQIVPKSAQKYAAEPSPLVLFFCSSSNITAYLKATSSTKERILRAHFNGYEVSAIVTSSYTGPHSHGTQSIWEEFEVEVTIALTAD